MKLTAHAIEQYISRWARDRFVKDAKEELLHLLETSKKTDRTANGDDVFTSDSNPEIRMVIKDRDVCITVLPLQKNKSKNTVEQNFVDFIDFYEENDEFIKKSAELEEQKKQQERKESKQKLMDRVIELKVLLNEIDKKRQQLEKGNNERKKLGNEKNLLINEFDHCCRILEIEYGEDYNGLRQR